MLGQISRLSIIIVKLAVGGGGDGACIGKTPYGQNDANILILDFS
jgi:hypothetical protein